VRLPRWARPAWPAAALALSVVVALVFSPDEVCTVSSPCGPQWFDAAGTMLLLPHLVWLFVLPELAVVSAPLLLLWMADPGNWQGAWGERIADGAVVAALCWGWAGVALRLRARRRQRGYALDAAGGVTAAVPRTVARVRRGVALGVTGVLVCGAAGFLLTTAVMGDRHDELMARTAAPLRAQVTAYDDVNGVVTVALDGRKHRIEVAGGYTVGDTIPVLAKGDWIRPAAEPYEDRTGRQALGLLGAGLGVSLVAGGLLAGLRAAALRRRPVPVLRVTARRRGGRMGIFAAGDGEGDWPVLSYTSFGRSWPGVREGVLYGAPYEGGEVLLTGAHNNSPTAQAGAGPVRQASAEVDLAVARRPRGDRTGKALAAHRRDQQDRLRVALATLKPPAGPVRWQGGPVGRLLGVLLVCVLTGMWIGLLADGEQGSVGRYVTWFLGSIWMAATAWALVTWRITADGTGLRVRARWRTRHVPWDTIRAVVYTRDGLLVVRTLTGTPDAVVGTVGWPWAERQFGLHNRAGRAAAELAAMVRDPALRPPVQG
jgi:hypothetical protein